MDPISPELSVLFLDRLTFELGQVCQIASIALVDDGLSATFEPDESATPGQIQDATIILNNFDWSESANTQWDHFERRRQAENSVREKTPQALKSKAIVLAMLDEINILRSEAGLSARTIRQMRNAIRNKMQSGDAD